MLRVPICPEILAALYEAGENITKIADRFSCDNKTIRRRAAELGLRHPNSPQQKQKRVYQTLREINAIERYETGESMMALAAAGNTSIDVLRPYLIRNGVKIRTRAEQTAATMAKYGMRFPKRKTLKNMRLYVYERDAYGLVTKVKIYQDDNPKPIVRYY